jgi:hypothetical protein
MRLNRWQCIGVVLSVAWATGGFFWVSTAITDVALKIAEQRNQLCLAGELPQVTNCADEFKRVLDGMSEGRVGKGLIVGLVPIPVAWLLVYAAIGIVRRFRTNTSRSP